jgi:hypothetical protein
MQLSPYSQLGTGVLAAIRAHRGRCMRAGRRRVRGAAGLLCHRLESAVTVQAATARPVWGMSASSLTAIDSASR